MFTVCPKCSLTLVVTTTDLRVAQGFVRCGRCSNVFNALLGLSEDRQAAALSGAESGTYQTLPFADQPQAPPSQAAAPSQSQPAPRAPQPAQFNGGAARAPAAPPPAAPRPAAQPAQRSAGSAQSRAATPAPQSTAPRFTPPAQPGSSSRAASSAPPAPAQRFVSTAPPPPPQRATPPRQPPVPQPTDEDEFADISLEFDATSTDLSQVFVEQPARRVIADASGTFRTITSPPAGPQTADAAPQPAPPEPEIELTPEPEPRPEPAAPPEDELGTQLKVLAAQIVPSQPQPTVLQTTGAPARAQTAPRPANESSSTSSTGKHRALNEGSTASSTGKHRVLNEASSTSSTGKHRVLQVKQPTQQAPREAGARQSANASAPARSSAPAREVAPQAKPSAKREAAAPSRRAASSAVREPAVASPKTASSSSRRTRAVADAPARRQRTPEELIQAAAEVVRRAGRRRTAAVGADLEEDAAVLGEEYVGESTRRFPARITASRRMVEAAEGLQRVRLPSLSWGMGAVALSALFVVQIINHYRGELATSDRLRKPLTTLYSAVGVPIVPRWDLSTYEVRQLGALAGNSGQLIVRLSVKNGAKSAQPLPYLRVTVQDRFGNRMAGRDVPPEIYAPKRGPGLLEADQRIDAEIAFVDPGPNAVGFEIDACLPTGSGGIACANDQIAR